MTTDSPDHLRWMRLALDEAHRAAIDGEVPVGAVIVLDEKVIGSGHNETEGRQDPTAHAEMLAIRRAADTIGGWRLAGADAYVTLEPCPMCAGALMLARIRTVVYGARDEKFGALGSITDIYDDENRWNHRVSVVSGVCAEESAELLRGFFRARRADRQ